MSVSKNDLATDFSNEVKSLQPRMPKLACDAKRKQLGEEFVSDLSPTERILLRNFNVSESDITDSELRNLLRIQLKTMTSSLYLLMLLEKTRKGSMSSWKKMLNYGNNDLPKYLCTTGID